MTYEQYKKKLEGYQTSSAPNEVKDKAIQKLNEEYHASRKHNDKALLQIQEQQADYSDIGQN